MSAAHGRSRDEILRFFGNAVLVPPGLVWVHEWPGGGDGTPNGMAVVAGVGQVQR